MASFVSVPFENSDKIVLPSFGALSMEKAPFGKIMKQNADNISEEYWKEDKNLILQTINFEIFDIESTQLDKYIPP